MLHLKGWIHHLARHAVACFLTRGDLWVSWEEGLKVFDELLLDADWWDFPLGFNESWNLKLDHNTWYFSSVGSEKGEQKQWIHFQVCECRHLVVAVLLFILPAVFPLLLPSQVNWENYFENTFLTFWVFRFGRKADANGDFIRRYLPVLKVARTKTKTRIKTKNKCIFSRWLKQTKLN